MRFIAVFLLASVHRAVAQSSVTVSMAWNHGNPWAAYEIGKFDDETSYLVGCVRTADSRDCIIYTPFTLTQAPDYARFTTTLPGESTNTFIHYCTWSGRTEGCGVSDNFGDGWHSVFWTPDILVDTETVIPLVTRRGDFLTLDDPSQTTSTTSTRRTPTFTQPWETASATGPDFDDGDDDDEEENFGGDVLAPPGFGGPHGGLPPGGGDEGYAERRVGSIAWVAGVVAVVSAALW